MHLHWERSPNAAGDCNIRSLSWMGRVPDEIPQEEGWKLNRNHYYQEGWLSTANLRGVVGVTYTTSHCGGGGLLDTSCEESLNLEPPNRKPSKPVQNTNTCDISSFDESVIKDEPNCSSNLHIHEQFAMPLKRRNNTESSRPSSASQSYGNTIQESRKFRNLLPPKTPHSTPFSTPFVKRKNQQLNTILHQYHQVHNSAPENEIYEKQRKRLVLHNKSPMWNEASQVYQLDFGGRVTQESAKNFQIEYKGKQVMQFGRIDNNAYTLDFQYPFTAVQAFAVALANVTQRLK